MKNRNSLYNIITAIILQITNFVSGFILPRVIITYYGSEINGLISSIKQIVNYATLIEAGIAGSAVYMLYKALFNKETKQINEIVSSAKKFYNKSGIMFLIIMSIISIIMPLVVKTEELLQYQVLLLVLILGINASLEFFSMGKYRVLLTADQKSYIINLVQAISIIINVIIIAVMAKLRINIIIVQICASVSYFIRALLLYIYISKKYPNVSYKEKKLIPIEQRGDVLLHQIGGMIVFNSPILIITFVSKDLVASSIYSIYHMIFMGLVNLVGVFNTSLVAGMGNVICEDNEKLLIHKYNIIEFLIYFITRLIYGIALICIIPFIKIYTLGFSDANYVNNLLGILIIIAGIVHSLKVPQSMIINAAGHFKKTRNKTIIESIICIIVGIAGVYILGYTGVILGIIVSGTYRTIDAILYVPKNIVKQPLKNTLKKILIYFLNISMTVVSYILLVQVKISNYFDFFAFAIIVAICELIKNLIISLICERREFDYIIGYFKKVLKQYKLSNRRENS